MAMDGVKPSAGSRLAYDLSHQAQEHETSGSESSLSGQGSPRRLNPTFVDWMLGWPLGWTACEPLGTEWSRWLRQSRFWLLRLA
jgi:DNA (cytosine-5)-methyltransferase 1